MSQGLDHTGRNMRPDMATDVQAGAAAPSDAASKRGGKRNALVAYSVAAALVAAGAVGPCSAAAAAAGALLQNKRRLLALLAVPLASVPVAAFAAMRRRRRSKGNRKSPQAAAAAAAAAATTATGEPSLLPAAAPAGAEELPAAAAAAPAKPEELPKDLAHHQQLLELNGKANGTVLVSDVAATISKPRLSSQGSLDAPGTPSRHHPASVGGGDGSSPSSGTPTADKKHPLSGERPAGGDVLTDLPGPDQYYSHNHRSYSLRGELPEAADGGAEHDDDDHAHETASVVSSVAYGEDGLPLPKKPRRLRPIKNTKKLVRQLSNGLSNGAEGLRRSMSLERSGSLRSSMDAGEVLEGASSPSFTRMKEMLTRLSFSGRNSREVVRA